MLLATVTGLPAILTSFGRVQRDVGVRLERALVQCGKVLLREAQLVVPVDTGNLKGSGFVRQFGRSFATEVIVGFTAAYAIFVHEDMLARHAPGKQAKFLYEPAVRLIPFFFYAIRRALGL